ncbi:MAG TPA: methylenetetrahydrofolate reductase [Xanthobacteraceae bacterium]|nr:methylenetetrahydrofolate reductase [Xanthobacteraceae bacterium]
MSSTITGPIAPPTSGDRPAACRVGDLMRGFSVEATMPGRAEIEALRGVLRPGSHVYLGAPPNHPPTRLIAVAGEVQAAGFVPVPHLAARAFASLAVLDDVVARLNGEAGVDRALVIAGDRNHPAGAFADALALIRSDVLPRRGILEIGIAAYPDGHPTIADNVLAAALNAKLDAALVRGLGVHIVTQFCFDAEQILGWLRRIRYTRIAVPVRIGIAGPASMRGLLRYALRCGVRASLRGMRDPRAAQLVGDVTPDLLVHELSDARALLNLEPLAVHVFSFGGLLHTARWAAAASGLAT